MFFSLKWGEANKIVIFLVGEYKRGGNFQKGEGKPPLDETMAQR